MRIFGYVTALCLLGNSVLAMDPGFFESPVVSPYIYDRVEIIEDPGPGDSWYARAVIRNVTGTYNQVEFESTTLGDVGIEYTTTRPSALNDPDSADTACAVVIPAEVIAIPECVTILEQESETIYLYRYSGG